MMRTNLTLLLIVVGLVGCSMPQEEKENIAAVTCSIMSETRNMDAAIRVEKMNDARDKIDGEPFLRGDAAIKEAFDWELCQELVLNETYDERLQSLKDAKRELERIAEEKRAEEQRIADSKPSVKEEFYSNGKLKSRTTYQSKTDGGKLHGLYEQYHENGQLQGKVNYKDGIIEDGPFESYDTKGQLEDTGNFKDGIFESYYENGQLKRKGNIIEGGPYEKYRENGQLEYRGNYKDGKLDGFFEVYKENGELNFKFCFNNDVPLVDDFYCEK